MRILLLKILLLFAFIIFNSQCAIAQLYIKGELLKVEPNALLHVNGNIITVKNGSIAPKLRNHGTIGVKGNVDFHADTDYKGQGKIQFLGTSQQTLSPNIPLKKIEIQNGNNVALSGNLNLQGEITLTNGHLELGNFDLTLDDSVTISGGSSSSYIRINGTGKLKANVGSSPVTFPIGRNPYLPVVIDDGGSAEYSIGVSQNVYNNPTTQTGLKTTSVVGETWTIQASSSQSNVSVTLQWGQSEEETGFTRNASMIGYWEDGVSTAWNSQGTLTGASGSGPYTLSRTINLTTNLFYFGVGSQGSALPVELTYFTANWNAEQDAAILEWETSQEIDNSHFEIQRASAPLGHQASAGLSHRASTAELDRSLSEAEGNWVTIGRVEGNGTTDLVHSYRFTDHSLLSSVNGEPSTIYYRLKQIDHNGNYEYSPIRSLSLTERSRSQISVYPIPAKDVVHLSRLANIKLINANGETVLELLNVNEMDVSALPAGIYFLQAEIEGSLINRKLFVE